MALRADSRRAFWAVAICVPTLAVLAGCPPPVAQAAAAQVPIAFFAPALATTTPPAPTPSPAPPAATRTALALAPVEDGEPAVIGTSVAGRALEVFRFGSGQRELLIVAGIHGGYEWNTIALADELIALLRDEPARIPPEVSLYILRSLNPDGEDRSPSHPGRAN